MTTRALYLAAYDVSSPSRLRAALALVRAYATGGQKSVHEVFLTSAECHELLHDMALLLDEHEDRFLLLRLDARGRVHTLGQGSAPCDPDLFYLG
ncbi:MAG: CRISPR-associated protein Cas2 [Ectothiorhodospira sp.]